MEKQIEIYVHGEGVNVARLVHVAEDAAIKAVLASEQGSTAAGKEEVFVFVEDEEEPRKQEEVLCEIGIKRRHHIHCHRCKRSAWR